MTVNDFVFLFFTVRNSGVYRQSFLLLYNTGVVTSTSCLTVYDAQLNAQWNTLGISLQNLCRNGSSYDVTISAPVDTSFPRFQSSYDFNTSPVSGFQPYNPLISLELFYMGSYVSFVCLLFLLFLMREGIYLIHCIKQAPMQIEQPPRKEDNKDSIKIQVLHLL